MAIAFRTSSAAGASSASQVTSQNLTIPAAILAGDVMLLVTYSLTSLGTGSTLSVNSTGTAWTQIGSTTHVTSGGFTANTAIWRCVATAADAGKVITASSGSDTSFWGLAIAAWSGVSPSAPVDVAPAGFTVAGTATIACPSATTLTAGDWAVYMLGVTASATPPTIPSGTTARESQYGGTNVGAFLCDGNGSAGSGGTSIGGGNFTSGSSSTWWAAFTVALKPAGAFDPYLVSTDGNGVQTWNVTYAGNQNTYPTGSPTGTGLRILPPASPSGAYPHCFVYDLPVNNGFDDTANGNGLDVIRGLAAQNTYNATIVEPSFAISPWYADKDSDSTLHLESFMVALRGWMTGSSFASGGEKHYLIGFSKSGIGGQGLQFKHPDLWTATASWDAPFMMTDYDGTDAVNGGTVGGSPAFNYGSSSNFKTNYQLSSANLTAWNTASGGSFTSTRRLWIGGYFSFQADVTAYKALLTSLGILHDEAWSTLDASHAWHADWVAPALASIIQLPPVTGTVAVASASPALAATGTVAPPPAVLAGSVSRPCYCSREDVKRALDLEVTAVDDRRVDRAIESVSETIEGHLHRYFYPWDRVVRLDWPNYQYAYPWTYHFQGSGAVDLAVLTSLQSPQGTAIPLWQVFLDPASPKYGWPFTGMQLDRSTVAAWGAGPTPQRSIWATGTWGWYSPRPAGTLTQSLGTSRQVIEVSDGSLCGVGDLLVLDAGTGAAPFPAYPATAGALGAITGERVIVTGKAAAAASLTQSGAGCTTASASDCALSVTGGGSLNVGEALLLDTEQVLVTDVTNGVATVKRAWNGTVLATHSAAVIYAYRQLTVLRGQLGTAAAAHASGAAVSVHRPPALIRDLAIAESQNRILQETSGYARTAGSGEAAMPAPGVGLADLWDEAETTYARKARIRAI